jgi:hypothetical protein
MLEITGLDYSELIKLSKTLLDLAWFSTQISSEGLLSTKIYFEGHSQLKSMYSTTQLVFHNFSSMSSEVPE